MADPASRLRNTLDPSTDDPEAVLADPAEQALASLREVPHQRSCTPHLVFDSTGVASGLCGRGVDIYPFCDLTDQLVVLCDDGGYPLV